MKPRINEQKPLTTEDFYTIVTSDDPRIHPKDDLVVYVKTTPEHEGQKYKRILCAFDLKTRKQMPLTTGQGGSDYFPRWSPDGKCLSFLSDRSGKPQIYFLHNTWAEAVQLTDARNGVQSFTWSPDSNQIAFVSRVREDERNEEDRPQKNTQKISVIEKKRALEDREHEEKKRVDPRVYYRTVIRQGTIFKDERNSHIYIQKLKGDRQAVRITDGNHDFGLPCWDMEGKSIITTSNQQTSDPDIDIRSDLVKIDIATKKRNFLTANEHGNHSPQVCPSGKWIYFFSFQNSERHKQRMKICRLPIDGGNSKEVIPGYDFDPYFFELDINGKWVYFMICYHGRDSILRVPADGGTPQAVIRFDGMVNSFHLSGNRLVYSAEAPDMPSDLFYVKDDALIDTFSCKAVDRASISTAAYGETMVFKKTMPGPKRLTHLNRRIFSKRDLSIPTEIWIDRPDGFKIQGWYMLPWGYTPGKPCPWVIQIHGGPHIMWGYSFWHEFQCMCARGYGVYFSNPRGSDGYGSAFKGAIHLRWGEDDSGDILAGADKMVEMGLADPDRLFLTGGSFGGFMTAWIVTHDNRFKAAVAQRGVYNFVSMYGASDALTLIEWEFDTLPWKNTELLWSRSPLKYVENVTTPTMILHSEQDYRVAISQAEEFYTALKREGKKTCLVRYPREGHELSRSGEPKHRVDRINRIIAWFDEHNPSRL